MNTQLNRLAAQTSPYLLQHARNPVDWYPWGPEALEKARVENKPILLSIGYSACHWCHVMAHESFEDPATAAVMNRLFVNVKVDREERPDLDKIYQTAQQLLTHRPGGWPLTMFLAPWDRQPFFGGTYFPNQARAGMPAFAALLERVAGYFRTHEPQIRSQKALMEEAFERTLPAPADAEAMLDEAPLARARAVLESGFDARHGGFGRAPKFPRTGSIERCLRHWYASSGTEEPDLKALFMATLTLTRMAEGGLCDQVGGGFYRYSVDEEWAIPHFEKMLYDNALLLAVYARAALATGEELFARTAAATAAWALREMRSPTGAFYSSIDADSGGREGGFYLWRRAELQALLPADEYDVFAHRYGLDGAPNFEDAWHLAARAPVAAVGDALHRPAAEVEAALEAARVKLEAARRSRTPPARDEKILTAWNALMIKGLAAAARSLRDPALAEAAGAAADFVRRELWRDGRLFAVTKDGRAHLPAYLDDHAFLADALLELLQIRWSGADLEFARALADAMLHRFEDARRGGFHFTASDHETLIHRPKSFDDDSLPSGNAVAASVLARLGYLLADLRYLDAAERALKAAFAPMHEHPDAHMGMLNALEDFIGPAEILIVRGAEADRWSRELGALYAPARMIFAIPDEARDLPPALAAKAATGRTVAYLCEGMTCSAPFEDLAELARRLGARMRR